MDANEADAILDMLTAAWASGAGVTEPGADDHAADR
jgi:hypothetical protein